jgi:SARP family transcriptional regulator, regulator of embCAB operon
VVERDGERLEGSLPGRQGRLLFVYLVLNRHRHVSRDQIAEALWREGEPASAGSAGSPGSPGSASIDASLNPLLSKLRRVLGPGSLDGRSTLRINLPDPWVDLEAATEAVHRAESAVAGRDWVRAWGPAQVALFVAQREVLVGEDVGWVDEVRRSLSEIEIRALECYAAAEFGVGGLELPGAVRSSRQLVRIAPLRETGYRYLMESLAAEGNLAESLHVYGELCDRLREQLGVSPSPATREVYQRLIATTEPDW